MLDRYGRKDCHFNDVKKKLLIDTWADNTIEMLDDTVKKLVLENRRPSPPPPRYREQRH